MAGSRQSRSKKQIYKKEIKANGRTNERMDERTNRRIIHNLAFKPGGNREKQGRKKTTVETEAATRRENEQGHEDMYRTAITNNAPCYSYPHSGKGLGWFG